MGRLRWNLYHKKNTSAPLAVKNRAKVNVDQVIEDVGQVSPEIERARRTMKPTGTDTD